MKNGLNFLVVMFLTFGTILQLRSQGYIVPNGVTIDLGNQVFVVQNPTNDYTAFVLMNQGANTFLFESALDEGVRVFLVSPNDPVSLQPIVSQNYEELLFPNTYVFDNGSPFYVGLYTGYTPQNGIYSDPLFGWAQLVNNNGTIELLGSALEYGGGGIYAGTQTIIPIPEPGALALAALGTLLLGFRSLKLFRKLNF